ncbi:cytochrome b [Pseudoalteromonas viridis]|uniref:Cytochrome b/b6 domain-containing protein n=1 Tax=Pseudoalteromonas viridis TaxID=339617 RepID=A0ABX7V919_9GAMM|nr:cytochrome b/b6 domain-containing protein [Pseudoalteromonas viridis]QTL35705.1 cytochrome b/b6 domain-containing protein [Pseudoalteromonas viridis]
MTHPTDAAKFDCTARALHWISASVILWALLSGFYMAVFELDTPTKTTLSRFNVALTFVYCPVFIWRVVHRVLCPPPAQIATLTPHQARLASTAHVAIYLLTALVLCSGVLMMEHPFSIFGWILVPPLLSDAQTLDWFARLHLISNILLLVIVTLHILAVIKHQLAGRAVLQRML